MSGDELREAERLAPAPPVLEPGRVRSALRLATITYVALPDQAYQLSGSSLVVGLLSLAELGPLLVTAFRWGRARRRVRPAAARADRRGLARALRGDPGAERDASTARSSGSSSSSAGSWPASTGCSGRPSTP